MVNTRFWADNYIAGLDIVERYLFLYFLTNEHTNICGIYELPMRNLCMETGLDRDHLEKILPRLEGKIHYIDGWVYIKNFSKHQSSNPSTQEGIKRALSEVPSEIMAKINGLLTPSDTVGTGSPQPALLNLTILNSTKPNLTESAEPAAPTPKDESYKFFKMIEEQGNDFLIFVEDFHRKTNVNKEVIGRELRKFTSYWTEPTPSGLKQRWQTQKTFEVKRRLATWFTNVKGSNFNSNKYQVGMA